MRGVNAIITNFFKMRVVNLGSRSSEPEAKLLHSVKKVEDAVAKAEQLLRPHIEESHSRVCWRALTKRIV